MKPLRIIALIIFLIGAGTTGFNVIHPILSGKIIGRYPLKSLKAESSNDFLSMLRRNSLLIGDETKSKIINTEYFSFYGDPGQIQLRLLVQRTLGSTDRNKFLRNVNFILFDNSDEVVFQSGTKGINKAWSTNQKGIKTDSIFYIGDFIPQTAKEYKVTMEIDDQIYAGLSTTLEIEARSNVIPTNYLLISLGVGILILGTVLLFITKPKDNR